MVENTTSISQSPGENRAKISREKLWDMLRLKTPFDSFWQSFKEDFTAQGEDAALLESSVQEQDLRSKKIRKEVFEFFGFLQKQPVVSVVVNCLREFTLACLENVDGKKYLSAIEELLRKNLIRIFKEDKELRLFAEFEMHEHLLTLEDIRCVKEWTTAKREELVLFYIQFSRDLARYTFGNINSTFDPDRFLVENKSVKYDMFADFVKHLSERDSLIAKLIYFCGLRLEDVLRLKVRDFVSKDLEIRIDQRSIDLPKHLAMDVKSYIQQQKGFSEDLIFRNLRKNPLDSNNLIHSFVRASSHLSIEFKITPASLLR